MLRAALCILALALGLGAEAAERRALVIGNDRYAAIEPLKTAVNDARAVAGRLAALGFAVTELTDAGRRETNRALQEFTDAAGPRDTLLFFYAGHAVEIDGQNYLLPTDIPDPGPGGSDFIRAEALALSGVLERLRGTEAELTIAFLDACRDNPFARRGTRGLGASVGLGRIAAPEGSFVVFSAGAGQAALDRLGEDDSDPNSVFTRTLLPLLDTPGMDLRDMVLTLRRRVAGLTGAVGHAQTPAYYDEMLGEFRFVPGADPAALDPVAADFAFAESIDTAAGWRAFLARHGGRADAARLAHARSRLAALDGEAGSAAAAAPSATDTRTDTGRAPFRDRPDGPYVDREGCARTADGGLIECPGNAGGDGPAKF